MKTTSKLLFVIIALLAQSNRAYAQSDLLVAPTRLVINGPANGEVVVSNSGARSSTYRVSLVLRRMNGEGLLQQVEEADASPSEQAALQMITFAPRKVILGPGQSQTVRIGIRPSPDVASGEYRAHLLFRAIPDSTPAPATPESGPAPATSGAADGMSIALTPIFGVTIPVIARIGGVTSEVQLLSAQVDKNAGQSGLRLEIGRVGAGSVYGNVEVSAKGSTKPLVSVKGIAVYPEIASRSVFIPVSDQLTVPGSLIVRFNSTNADGQRTTVQIPAP